MDDSGYEWLEYGTPSEGYLIASVFGFFEGISAEEVVELGAMSNPVDVHLRDQEELLSCMTEIGPGFTAVFEQDGWTVLYQDNGVPDRTAEPVAALPSVARAVIAFWDVNALTELTYWETGVRTSGFSEWPSSPVGTDYDRVADDLAAVGLAPEDNDFGDIAGEEYRRMLAFADRITGTHLGPDFLLGQQITVGLVEV